MTGTRIRTTWRKKALAFTLSSTAAGMLSGAVLGAVGADFSTDQRSAVAFAAAVTAIGIASAQLSDHRFGPLQRDRETPRVWLYHRPVHWALLNGFALGLGITSRLGFWLWYAVPVAAFCTGDASLGAILYGSYALARASGVWVILPVWTRHGGDAVIRALVHRLPRARLIADCQLLLLGLATAWSIWPR